MDLESLIHLLVSIGVGMILIQVYFKIADKNSIIDKPNERSSHATVTIRGAGVIFPVMAALFLMTSGFQYPWFVLGMVTMGVLGFIDDLKNLSARVRTIIQLLALSTMFYEVGVFALPILVIVALYIFVTGLINAYNFMDGINGITGLYTLSILIPVLFANNSFHIHFISNELLMVMIGACLVFLFFNLRKKAMCFLGDAGSVSIALLIAFIILSLSIHFEAWYFFVLMSVYGVDSILTIAHRLLRRERIFEAHRFHLYQLLANEEKWSHASVSVMYASIQLVANFSLWLLPETYRWPFAIGSVLLLSVVYIFMKSHLVKRHEI